MKPGSLRGFALAAAIVVVVLWLAPALLLSQLATRVGASAGISLEIEGVRPALPFGIVAERAVVTRGGARLEITQLSARILPSGARVEAHVGEGTLLLRTEGLTLDDGFLRAQSLPLEWLRDLAPGAFALRGSGDGVYRFGARETLELTLSRGAVELHAPIAVDLPFAQLVVVAARVPDGGWRLDFADLRGPALSGTARGSIGADGNLALTIEITQLEEPVRSAFSLAAFPTGPVPFAAELQGPLDSPRFSQVTALPR